jgi:uncharacterized membrane protein
LFGIPLGVYGVVFYGLLFILTFLAQRVAVRFAHDALAGLATIGFIASVFFILIQIYLIKALCIYCLASAIISFLAFVLAFLVWKQFTPANKASNPDVVAPPVL